MPFNRLRKFPSITCLLSVSTMKSCGILSKACCSVTQSCLTLCNPTDCSMPGIPFLHHLLDLAQTHVYWVSDAIQLSRLCHPLLLLPSIFPSIRVFSNESALRIRWPKYWNFSFNISPSNEYSGLISFRIDWFESSQSSPRDSQESSLIS